MRSASNLLLATLLAAGVAPQAACSKKKPQTTPVATAQPEPKTDPRPAPKPPAEKPAPTAPEPPPPPDASLTPVVYFEFDSSTLSDSARAELEANARWLEADPKRTLTIEGHTDEVGTTEYNLALGERRAKAARDYLVRLGIAGGRINVLALGEERPASDDDAENRRAMFVATGR